MKVKFFEETYTCISLEEKINEFIKDKKIIDIKYSSVFEGPKQNFERLHFTAMVMYE